MTWISWEHLINAEVTIYWVMSHLIWFLSWIYGFDLLFGCFTSHSSSAEIICGDELHQLSSVKERDHFPIRPSFPFSSLLSLRIRSGHGTSNHLVFLLGLGSTAREAYSMSTPNSPTIMIRDRTRIWK